MVRRTGRPGARSRVRDRVRDRVRFLARLVLDAPLDGLRHVVTADEVGEGADALRGVRVLVEVEEVEEEGVVEEEEEVGEIGGDHACS